MALAPGLEVSDEFVSGPGTTRFKAKIEAEDTVELDAYGCLPHFRMGVDERTSHIWIAD